MAPTTSTSTSLKDYLKKYQSNEEEEKKKKKKKKKPKPVGTGVLVVDEDPVWQKPVKLDEEEDDSPDEKPVVNEDIEVKRMKRLEQIRARRSYNQISEDGSGWVSISDAPKHSNSADPSSDVSPPRNRVARYDTPSPEASGREDVDLSPPRHSRRRNDSPSPEPVPKPLAPGGEDTDLSPPRQRRRRNDSPSPEPEGTDLSPPRKRGGSSGSRAQLGPKSSDVNEDLSPPRQRRRRYESPSPQHTIKATSSSQHEDLSPPRRRGRADASPVIPRKNPTFSGEKESDFGDLSPPRKRKEQHMEADLSPPRRKERKTETDLSPPRKRKEQQAVVDLSPPRKKEQRKTGLITGKDVREEITKTKKDEWFRFSEMDPSASGRGAEPVYRIRGERVSKEEYLKLTKKEEKPKEEKKLEWGKGLAQKREAEARLQELELEKNKPFARSRDDPELDRMMKDRLRWGDPMAHLVKKKQHDLVLPNLGEDEKMKESGFIVPQEIPSHSWLKRGLDFEPNRYGIKPGRHWDGVNRSNGCVHSYNLMPTVLGPNSRPMIITPSNVLPAWEEEFTKWNTGIPFLNMNKTDLSGAEDLGLQSLRYAKDSKTIRLGKLCAWKEGRGVLGISYSLFEKMTTEKEPGDDKVREVLLQKAGIMVLDEGHTPRNHRSLIWKALFTVSTRKKIILSGTPFQNNFQELYNIIALVRDGFVDPCLVDNHPRKRGRKRKSDWDGNTFMRLDETGRIKELKARIKPFVHVYKGDILKKTLLGLLDSVLILKPSDLQRRCLRHLESLQSNLGMDHLVSITSVHPSLLLKSQQDLGFFLNEELKGLLRKHDKDLDAGVKTRFVFELIKLSIGEKVLVFSQYIHPLDHLEELLRDRLKWTSGKEILFMDGKREAKQRQNLIKVFNDPNSEARVLLASTRACCEGIHLVGASRVILLDVVWNPSVERQPLSRAYRLGQKKNVYVYHLIIAGTQECTKYSKMLSKDWVSEMVFSASDQAEDLVQKRRGSAKSTVSEDRILEEMVNHEKTRFMFEKIIYQPKADDLIESFGC